MKPAPFTYFAPGSLDEALSLLEEHDGEAKVLAGGQSLVPLMNFRLMRPRYLVDINGLKELSQLKVSGGRLALGALTRQVEVERSAEVARSLPILSEAIGLVAHPAIRNRGTVGGSLVHADPAAEIPVVATALDAELELKSKKRGRSLKVEEFYLGYLTTGIAPDELLLGFSLELPPAGAGWAFTEYARRHGDFAIVAVAALLAFDTAGKTNYARIALGGVGPVPERCREAEALLMGKEPTDALFREAAKAAASAIDPESDIHASASYRRQLSEVYVRRGLEVARGRVGGSRPHA
jgi:CO/xanthine dehydrogenase FAD-binding subunit